MFVVKRNQIIITALVIMIAVAGYLNFADSQNDTIAPFVYGEEGDISALVPDSSAFDQTVMVNSTGTAESDLTELTNTNVISDDIGIALTPEDDVLENEASAADTSADTEDVMEETDLSPESENIIPEEESISEPGEAMFVSASIDSTYFVQAKLDREQSRSKQKELLMEMINNQNLEAEKKADCADAMLDIQKRIEKESATEAMIEAKGFKEVFVRIDDQTVDVVVSKEVLSDAEIAQIEDIVRRKTGFETSQIRISPMNQ